MSRAEPTRDEIREHVRRQRRPMLVARAAGGVGIILGGVVSFCLAKLLFEPATAFSWYTPFLALALLQLAVLVYLRRPVSGLQVERIALFDVVAACAVISWGGALSQRTHSSQLFLLGVCMSAAALVPWGPRIQALLAVTVLVAVQVNAFLVAGDFLSALGFPTMVPMVILLATSIYIADSLDRTRMAAGKEELLRVRAEEETRELNKKLEERVAERTAEYHAVNRELEAFTYSVAHDLRAPLRSMDGFAAAVLDDYGSALDETGRQFLRRIRGSAQKLGNLIDDLLKLAQVARLRVERRAVDLSAVFADAVVKLEKLSGDREVEVLVGEGITVHADASLLRLAVENLLANAWKFTGNEDAPRIECGAMEDAGRSVYFVRDNGVGFDDAYAEKIFKVFERLHTDAQFEGTGVGLATVRHVVERHGGRVWASGETGVGAVFYFTLDEFGEADELDEGGDDVEV